MTIPLLEHVPGCSPIERCESCALEAYLRHHLEPHEYEDVVRQLSKLTGHKPRKSKFNPEEFEFLFELKGIIKVVSGIVLQVGDAIQQVPPASLGMLVD